MFKSTGLVMFLMAWRNLWRNRVRTLIVISAIGGSYGLSLFSMGMGDDMHGSLADKAGEIAGGHVLVHAKGFHADRESSQIIDAPPALLQLLRATPGVVEVAPRVLIAGLLTTSESSAPIMLQGVDTDREKALFDPTSKLTLGVMPKTGDGGQLGHPIVLGKGVMAELSVKLGDRVVLTSNRADGEVGRALFLVTGVIATGSRDLDRAIAYTNLAGARSALGLKGSQVHELGIVADMTLASETIKTAVLATLNAWDSGPGAQKGGKTVAGKTVTREVLTWQQAMPEIVGFIEIDDAFNYVFLIVLFIIVAFAIANSFLMVVMERVREFGLLSALGVTGPRIAGLLILETAVLTLVSLTAGFLLGFTAHLALQHWGLDVAELYGVEMGVGGIDMGDMVLRSELRPVKWLTATVGAGTLVMLSALYPAWKATRMAPSEAMRFYE